MANIPSNQRSTSGYITGVVHSELIKVIQKFIILLHFRNKIKKELYSETAGLLGNHGEEWWRVRSLVQQDMLRPKSAMFYIDSLEEISQEFVAKMSAKSDSEMEVDDVLSYIHRWALESVAEIFLNTRLRCLADDMSPDSDTARIIAAVMQVLGPMSIVCNCL